MINCTITSPEKTTTYKNIQSIVLPAFSGQIQILPDHAESFVLLQQGNISLHQLNKGSEVIQIMNGECHIKDNVVMIIL